MGLLESMSCGIPVVTTRVGMSEDVILDNIPGEISNKIDSNIIASKIEEILETFYKNKNESQKIIRKHILNFDWSEIGRLHWEKVYKDIV